MGCTGTYTNSDIDTPGCVNFPYCSHYGGAFYNPIPPWLRGGEAWHSDIPKGEARALIDGPTLLRYLLADGGKMRMDCNPTKYGRMFRHPKVTGRWTTQETLSFID